MAVIPPSGWEVAIYRRPPGHGEQTLPVLHAATVPLPADRGDYGSGVVELLGSRGRVRVGAGLRPEAAGAALFSGLQGVPGLTPDAYRPNQLQRTIQGQAGVQRFFTTAGRGFCLYSVIGAFANRVTLTGRANAILGSVRVGDWAPMSLPATAAPYLAATVLLAAAGVAKTVRPGDTANALRAGRLCPSFAGSGPSSGSEPWPRWRWRSPPSSFPGALDRRPGRRRLRRLRRVRRGGPPQGLGLVVVRLLRPARHSPDAGPRRPQHRGGGVGGLVGRDLAVR